MAGIGWRLEHLIHRGVAGAAAAYATGAAVMALPWVLTTAVLVTLPLLVGRDLPGLAAALGGVNVAYAIALLVAGPVQVVVSRFAADRLYEGRRGAIPGPLFRGLALALLACAAVTAATLAALRAPVTIVLGASVLAAAVGAQWTALSAGNGLCTPGSVLVAVGSGALTSFACAAALVKVGGLGLPGFFLGLVAGQVLTLALALRGILRALPDEADEGARLAPAFGDYRALAGAGLAFNASLWVDKLLVWRLFDPLSASHYASASTLAWFSTIPCLSWIFVEVETRFHRRFHGFFRALEDGATLTDLRRRAHGLGNEAARLLRGATSAQAGVLVLLELAAGPVARRLQLPAEAVLAYRILLVAATAQAVGLLGLILLYYFDLRREAFTATSGLLAAVATLTTGAILAGLPPGAGTAAGCTLGALLIWRLVFACIPRVLEHTLLEQPGVWPRRRRAMTAGANYASRGSTRSGSIPYSRIALSTESAGTLPSSASACSVATTMFSASISK